MKSKSRGEPAPTLPGAKERVRILRIERTMESLGLVPAGVALGGGELDSRVFVGIRLRRLALERGRP